MNGTFLFPGAGSFGGEFQLITDALKPAAWLIKYPGRFGRDFGVPATSFEEVVRVSAEQIARRGQANPVLCGFSFGAYVAYATALRMQQAGKSVAALVLAGASAPGQRTEVPAQATGTPAEVASYLDSVDPMALAEVPSVEWREVVIDTVASDLRLLRQFDAAPHGAVHCPILTVRGVADPLTSDEGVGEWKSLTDGAFSSQVFPGGHSDFLRSPASAAWIREVRDGLS